ncbi:DUF2187 family protein [Lysinibacillus capsici]|uniref:DUF2187 family protein n=1 Tax=Lysinibacillus capsici TaxID=2115968 RepID=UPI00272FA26F|nr:DUF2187 family protein [Lysinibacillus capsici]MDP1395262.1 DUF2187 family protein [Lysinibacillus capsici]MDP1415728.1 DUF2187 family protein [Lysinibacillus capsici]MDP1431593.1 DUF2187 family protein [Lysinibacillus capsici]
MGKAKIGDVIEWEEQKTNATRMGIVRKVLINSVIVDIDGTYDATVVSHKRYKIKSEA